MASCLYSKLNTETKEVRLVQLEPAASYEDGLVGRLFKVSLLDKPHFQALSYVCGDDKDLKLMTLSETEVSVYKNLNRALRHVRSTEDTITLWVDQLSIDQTNLEERSQQVRLMSDIYDVAIEVFVHIEADSDTLPEEHKYVESVVKTITTLGQLGQGEHYEGPLDLHRTWSDLLRFFKNDYWFRIWTSQELILARKVTFYYEKYLISDEIVDSFYTWYVKHMGYGKCCNGKDHDKLTDSAIDIAIQAYATTKENRLAKQQGQTFDLLELLSSVRHRLTTVLHDKVFALAGLTLIPPEILDYKLPVELAFERTTVHLIESMGNLDIFNHLSTNGPNFGSIRSDQSSARNTRNDYDRLPKLTSWSPDWSMYFKSKEMKFLTDRLELLVLYHAAEDTPATFKYVSPRLTIPGVRCGVISKVFECYERPLIFGSNLIQPWAKSVDISLDETLMSDGHFDSSARLRFIVALTGGISVRSDGAFILMETREDYLHNEFLFMHWWQLRMESAKEFTLFCGLDVQETLEYYDEDSMQQLAAGYKHLVRRNCILRRFAVLEDGKFAFVPPTAMPGDLVCVLKGGRTPFVLGTGRRLWLSRSTRPGSKEERTYTHVEEPKPEEDGCFQLVGDAYVESFMKSPVLTATKELEEFVLV